MTKNNVKLFRAKRKLSQKALASLAGTSQQHIQRVETKGAAISLELATAISQALGETLGTVFPAAAQALEGLRRDRSEPDFDREAAFFQAREAGVEADGTIYTLKLFLRGIAEPILLEVAAADRDRLYRCFQAPFDEDSVQFVVFDSSTHRIAINPREIDCWQFLFDAPFFGPSIRNEHDEPADAKVEIYFAGRKQPLFVEVEPDEPADSPDDMGQLSSVFFSMEMHIDRSDSLRIVDIEGEHLFIRPLNVSLLSVPIALLTEYGEGYDDEATE